LTVYKPLAESGYDSAKIRSVGRQIGVYMGRKIPGMDFTLRDKFIADWIAAQAADAGTSYTPVEAAARVDSESKSTGLKSARMASAARADNTAGPGTVRPASPLPAVQNSVRALTESDAEVSDAALLVEVHKILSTIGRRLYMSDGHWSDKPGATVALGKVEGMLSALREDLDGERGDWSNILDHLYGAKAREAAEAAKTANLPPEETPEEETPETVATPEAATA
jgi:hypothetical protein